MTRYILWKAKENFHLRLVEESDVKVLFGLIIHIKGEQLRIQRISSWSTQSIHWFEIDQDIHAKIEFNQNQKNQRILGKKNANDQKFDWVLEGRIDWDPIKPIFPYPTRFIVEK